MPVGGTLMYLVQFRQILIHDSCICTSCLQKLALQLKAQFTNVTSLHPTDPDHTLMLRLKCTSCHEQHPKLVGVTPSDSHEMTKGARGSANLVMSCAFCKKESSAKFEEPPLWRQIDAGDGGAEWKTLCVLDFRGLEPVGFDPSVSESPRVSAERRWYQTAKHRLTFLIHVTLCGLLCIRRGMVGCLDLQRLRIGHNVRQRRV